MEKVRSPFINNAWRACTVISLLTNVVLISYLNQGHDAMPSVSISSIHVSPSSRAQPPPDSSVAEKNVTSADPFSAEKNLPLEHLSAYTKNEMLEDPLATEKNETLQVPSATEKNETLEGLPQFKIETLEVSPQFKNETLEDSPQVKQETSKDDNRMTTGDNSAEGYDTNYCDIFDGRWVHDPTYRPMYDANNCPFLGDQANCRRNGRPDLNYERWNWVGSHCEIPRMNRTDMLERLRGKRVIIVGDSLNKNMFDSLACLLYSSIPSSDSNHPRHWTFRSKSYNCLVEFYLAPFLVEMGPEGQEGTRILTLDKINHSARKWKGANVMIFNSGQWWVYQPKRWDVIRYKSKMTESMGLESAFLKAMKTWSRWVDRNVNPAETTVFFRSISPGHYGMNWCFDRTEPLMDEPYIERFPSSLRGIVENRIRSMRTPVRYLNITKLAEYRIDAHPEIYTTNHGGLLSKAQRKRHQLSSDCLHWCIPGVPDTWNRLVYASLVLDGFGANSTSLKPTVSSR